MRLRSLVLPLAILAGSVLTPSAPAQIVFGEFGFLVSGTSGAAGDSCWGFDCVPRPLTVRAGETLDVTVRAPLGAPYAVFASPGLGQCFTIPGIQNPFNLDPSLVLLVFFGTIDRLNGALYCYDGLTIRPLALPNALPPGTTAYLQAAAMIGTPQAPATGVAMSSTVQLTVR